MGMNLESDILILQEILDHSKRIVFFGGAGVSTGSGIPDFRSDNGLYTGEFEGLSPETILSSSFFYLRPETFFRFYRKYMLHPEAKPNIVHKALFRLEQQDRLRDRRTPPESREHPCV